MPCCFRNVSHHALKVLQHVGGGHPQSDNAELTKQHGGALPVMLTRHLVRRAIDLDS